MKTKDLNSKIDDCNNNSNCKGNINNINQNKNIPVFRPHWNDEMIKEVSNTIKSCWWGSGPKASLFEKK